MGLRSGGEHNVVERWRAGAGAGAAAAARGGLGKWNENETKNGCHNVITASCYHWLQFPS
jgi:hypothetical protein